MATSVARPIAAPRPVTPVSILAARLHDLCEQVEALDGAADELAAGLREVCALASGLDPYLSECTTPESAALAALAERTGQTDWSRSDDGVFLEQEMLSGHVEGQALKFLVHMTRAERVLEIGMFTGYSALAMAEALPDGGEVIACEIDAEVAAFAQECFDQSPGGGMIDVRIGPAMDTLADLAAMGEPFDLIFIDADKGGYVDYVGAVLEAELLSPNGVICVDNTLMQGQPYLDAEPTANGEAIATFNQAVADDPSIEQVMIPLRDGLTLIRRV